MEEEFFDNDNIALSPDSFIPAPSSRQFSSSSPIISSTLPVTYSGCNNNPSSPSPFGHYYVWGSTPSPPPPQKPSDLPVGVVPVSPLGQCMFWNAIKRRMTQDPEERKSGDARVFSVTFNEMPWEVFRGLFPWVTSDRRGTVWCGYLGKKKHVNFVFGGKRRKFCDGGYADLKKCDIKYTPENNKLSLRFTYCVYTFKGEKATWDRTNAHEFDCPCPLDLFK